MGGLETRMWISRAPAERSMATRLRLVVPRTIESSTTTTRFPSRMRRTALNFRFTPKSRFICCGGMLLGQLPAQAPADQVHALSEDLAVRAREVDQLEHARTGRLELERRVRL